VSPNTIEYVWTGEFDLNAIIATYPNTLRVDGEIFESGTEKVADSKISEYVWTGPEACDLQYGALT